ncbi:MAG: Sua5/YciO/YrdC/YwlC family protein [Anaerolineales bacterium]
MKRIHILLGVQSLLAVLVSVNRLSPWTLGYVLPNEFLRWVDLNNMLLALASMVAFYLLKKTIEREVPAREQRRHLLLNVLFIVGLFLLAAAGPMAVTSANLAGGANARSAEEVLAQLGGRIELVLDGGITPGEAPSTVVDLTGDEPRILRVGPVSEEEIRKALA